MSGAEARERFACFGGVCTVLVGGPDAARAAARARARLLDWHARFSRFLRESELSRVNREPAAAVALSDDMAALAAAVIEAGERSGGLVDGTLVGALEAAGYDAGAAERRPPLPLALALRLAPPRAPAAPRADAATRGWAALKLDCERRVLYRPPGVALDSGGLAKGLFADLLAAELGGERSFAIDCAGDLRLGGAARDVRVESPFGGPPLHSFRLAGAGVATSGISRRAWLDRERGRPAHHLLDPASGRPAYTGVVQATAIAPTAVEAEWRAKAALLSGPRRARDWLAHGGALVFDDGTHALVAASERPRVASASAGD